PVSPPLAELSTSGRMAFSGAGFVLPTSAALTMVRCDAVRFAALASVRRLSVVALKGLVSLDDTVSDPVTRYVNLPCPVMTEISSPAFSLLSDANGPPHAMRCAAMTALPGWPGNGDTGR